MPRKLPDLLKAYAEYTSESDSPQIFHMWMCLSTIAGAAQRKIFMQSQHFSVYPNMYILLVSPPGRGKKTSALRSSKHLLEEVMPEVNFAAESGSMEALFEIFLDIQHPTHQSLTLYSMELGTLMATNPASMIDFLTDIYDGNKNFTRATIKGGGKKTIKAPFLNLIAGTTPKWLGEHLGLIALEGGLIARCVIAYSEDLLLNNAWPEASPKFDKLRKEIINDLSVIATIFGEVKFAPDALEWYSEWYLDKSRYPLVSDPRTAGYFDRKHIHLLKVAMSLSLSYKDELVLELEDLHRALDMLNMTEPGIRLALNSVGKNDSSVETFHLLSQIKSLKSAQYGQLLITNFHQMKYGKRSFDQALEELRVMGKIQQNGPIITYVGE